MPAPASKTKPPPPTHRRFEAGTFEPTAGAYSPFTLKLARPDGTAAAARRSTRPCPRGCSPGWPASPTAPTPPSPRPPPRAAGAEQAAPSCPAASRVGSLNVGAGAGPTPFYLPGNVYLAGPYKGAPLSLGDRDPGAGRSLRPRRRRPADRPPRRPRSDPDPRRLRSLPGDPARASRSTCARSRSTSTPPVHHEPDHLRSPWRSPAPRPEPDVAQLPGRRMRQARLQAEARAEPQGRDQTRRPPGAERRP